MDTLYTFQIFIEKRPEDEDYSAWTPGLPDCFARAKTLEDAKRKIRETIHRRVGELVKQGEDIRQDENLVHIEEITMAIRTAAGDADGGAKRAG